MSLIAQYFNLKTLKMKKLILSSALVLALCLSFTSCREKKEAAATEDAVENAVEETTDEATEAVEEVTDSIKGAVDDVTEAVEGAVDAAAEAVEEAVDDAAEAAGNELTKAVGKLKKDN